MRRQPSRGRAGTQRLSQAVVLRARAARLAPPGGRVTSRFTFLYWKVSWLAPTVGIVHTTSFTHSLYRMVVLPALSRPTMTILYLRELKKRA